MLYRCVLSACHIPQFGSVDMLVNNSLERQQPQIKDCCFAQCICRRKLYLGATQNVCTVGVLHMYGMCVPHDTCIVRVLHTTRVQYVCCTACVYGG